MVEIALQIADALEAAHAKGIIHRDPTVVTALRSAPIYRGLHSHPGYRALLRTMNLGS